MDADMDADRPIKCAFLTIVKPSTRNIFTFIRDCSRGGLSTLGVIMVGCQVVYRQQGLWALLTGCAPDLYNLENVPTISHNDLFFRHQSVVRPMLRERADEKGNITLQDCIDSKVRINKLLNGSKPVVHGSQLETTIAYLFAGGTATAEEKPEYPHGCVNCEAFLSVINGVRPKTKTGQVGFNNIKSTSKLGKWPDEKKST